MQLIQHLHDALADFADQREDMLMCVRCSDGDSAIVLKMLRDLDIASESDVFVLFGGPFVEPSSFVTALVDDLREQHYHANAVLLELGREALPPIPTGLANAARPPAARLRETLEFATTLLPEEPGHRVVYGLIPSEFTNSAPWLELVSTVVPTDGIQPWMRWIRVVARLPGLPADPAPDLSNIPRTRLVDFDLGPDALEASLRAEAADESRPAEARMQALMSVATLDFAHGRYETAIANYRFLLAYYQRTENLSMQAMVMHGFGDIFRRIGSLDQAEHWYECATVPASQCNVPVVLATVVRSLALLNYDLGRYPEATQLFDGLTVLAEKMLDPELRAFGLDWAGQSRAQHRDDVGALKSWEECAEFCRSYGLDGILEMVLGRLSSAYQRLGMYPRAIAARTELQNVRLKSGGKA